MSKHHWNVKKVLKYFHKAGLYAKVEKCKFYFKLVEYLEYIFSLSGLTMSNNKVKIIQDWPEPKKVKDIQSYLGFANFYCWFIFNYSDIVILLTYLCHMQVHLSRNYIPMVISSPNYTRPPFLQHVLWQYCNHLGILSSIVEILLFNSVFHDRVIPVSVSTLKPLLGVIGVLPLKPWASPILSICI